MNRKELIKKIAQKYEVSQDFAMHMCEAVFETINDELNSGNDVYIYGFGNFKHKVYKGKKFLHPITKEINFGADRTEVVFKRSRGVDKIQAN